MCLIHDHTADRGYEVIILRVAQEQVEAFRRNCKYLAIGRRGIGKELLGMPKLTRAESDVRFAPKDWRQLINQGLQGGGLLVGNNPHWFDEDCALARKNASNEFGMRAKALSGICWCGNDEVLSPAKNCR